MQLISHFYERGIYGFISETVQLNTDTLVNYFWKVCSAKQTARPDSMLTCCREVVPYLKQSLLQESWKAFFISNQIFNRVDETDFKKDVSAIEKLNELEKAIENGQVGEFSVTQQEVEYIENLLIKIELREFYLKLNAYLSFVGKDKLWKTLKVCHELFKPMQEDCITPIQNKIKEINLLKEAPDALFKEKDKLTSKDIRLLTVALDRKKLLEALARFQIRFPYGEELRKRWITLEQINFNKDIQYLKDLCLAGFKSGRVFFYDWKFLEMRDFIPFGLIQSVKHVFWGRLIHVGIIVKGLDNQPALSHVNGATQHHAIHPIKFPFLGAFGNFVELDISPLISSKVSEEHKIALQTHFLESFIKLASKQHTDVPINGLSRLAATFVSGHKSLSAHNLSDVNLDSKESQICSSYVGIIFLQAIHEVNQQLFSLGYQEKIEHPFGSHEILNRVDTLRLLYHWKQLKVMKVVPIDTFIAKVFDTPQL